MSAPMDILGILTGPGARSGDEYAAMAATKRSMTEDEIGDVRADFERSDSELQNVVKPKCRT